MIIQEFGLLRQASGSQNQLWLRAGGIYNWTRYDRLDGGGKQKNWAAYVLADYQVLKPDARALYRGIYVGASAMLAPGQVNIFKQTYEGRVYAVGMVPGRPKDSVNLTVDYNLFSKSGAEYYRSQGSVAHSYQFSIGALYSFNIMHGVFAQPSISYTKNPAFTANFSPAITTSMSLAVLF